jgi:hypothetical protein
MIEDIDEWFTGPSRKELKEQVRRLEVKLAYRDLDIKQLRRMLNQTSVVGDPTPQGKDMSSGFSVIDQYNLGKDEPFRVIESRPDKVHDHFVSKSFRKTYEEALELAQKLAVQYPQNKYYVSGVLATVKAEIPVASVAHFQPVANEKVDTTKQG